MIGKFAFSDSNIPGLAHLCSGISPIFVLSEAKVMIEARFSGRALGAGVCEAMPTFEGLYVDFSRGGGLLSGLFGARLLGVEAPEDDLESEESFRPGFGLTQPSVVAGPNAVKESSGALFERTGLECCERLLDPLLLVFLLCPVRLP